MWLATDEKELITPYLNTAAIDFESRAEQREKYKDEMEDM